MNIKTMIPFLDEEELEQLAEKIISSPTSEYQGITLSCLLPFLDDDYLDELLIKAYKKGDDIASFLPFVSQKALHEIVVAFSNGERVIGLKKMLPFLENQDVELIAKTIMNMGGEVDGITIDSLLPFLDDEVVDQALMQAYNEGDVGRVKNIVPFASDTVLHDIADAFLKNGLHEECIDALWPFFDENDIKTIFKRAMQQ